MDRGAWYIPLDLKEVDINEATQHSPMHIDPWRLLTILFTTYINGEKLKLDSLL